MMTNTVFEQIVGLTEDYLGPAARRFVSRQIAFHLDKHPEEVTTDDIPKLTEWTRVTLSMLTEDKRMVAEYATKMTNLMKAR